MKRLLLIFVCFYCFASIFAFDRKLFSLKSSGYEVRCKTLDVHVCSGFTRSIPLSDDAICGCSVDGSFSRISKNYLLRIIVKDKGGTEYLVMESYKEILDTAYFEFHDYGEESLTLNGVYLDSLKIVAIGVDVRLNAINIARMDASNLRISRDRSNASVKTKRLQAQDVISRINTYNTTHKKLWAAGITPLALKSYEERKRILGIGDEAYTGGEEYYYDGIFEVGDYEDSIISRDSTSSFVPSFDWRNRHGKNWITSVKSQGDSGYCSAFTAIACTEAMARLYYNQLIDVDLSEQEAACCNGSGNVWTYGMAMSAPLNYIKNHGVCEETAYPFVNDSLESLICRSTEITPYECLKIGGYTNVPIAEESMKRNLIAHGPLCSCISFWWPLIEGGTQTINHAMLIVGYGRLEVGDSLYYYIRPDGSRSGRFVVEPDDPRVGMTYWIYKDSNGDEGTYNGYRHYIHYNLPQSAFSTYIHPEIQSLIYTDDDIVCEDADGDGYYFWGLGAKPSRCPSWIPDTPDGDDSTETLGEIDEYGQLKNLNSCAGEAYLVSGNDTISTRESCYTDIRITQGSKLTVMDIMNLFGRVSIYIESDAELVIDGGVLTNAVICISDGGKLTLKNNGKLILRTNSEFSIPAGALMDLKHGEILRSGDF